METKQIISLCIGIGVLIGSILTMIAAITFAFFGFQTLIENTNIEEVHIGFNETYAMDRLENFAAIQWEKERELQQEIKSSFLPSNCFDKKHVATDCVMDRCYLE